MTAWTTISNALVAVGAKPFATTVQAFRDNVIAAFEGDATAVAAGVTLRDAALNTGAASTAGTDWVALRTAGVAAGAVGSYAILTHNTTATLVQFGFTYAGSALRTSGMISNGLVQIGAAGLAGTWRAMGIFTPGAAERGITLFLRIS